MSGVGEGGGGEGVFTSRYRLADCRGVNAGSAHMTGTVAKVTSTRVQNMPESALCADNAGSCISTHMRGSGFSRGMGTCMPAWSSTPSARTAGSVEKITPATSCPSSAPLWRSARPPSRPPPPPGPYCHLLPCISMHRDCVAVYVDIMLQCARRATCVCVWVCILRTRLGQG